MTYQKKYVLHPHQYQLENNKNEKNKMTEQLRSLKQDNDNKTKELKEKNKELDDLMASLDDMKNEHSESEQKSAYLVTEVNTWK